jgi:hypothetical protein
MNTKLYSPIVQLLVIWALLLTGCAGGGPEILDGQVINIFHSTAEWIVDGCKAGACGSEIFTKGNLIVYSRPFLENASFIITSDGIPTDKLSQVTGNLVNLRTWDQFRAWMLENGWTLASSGPALQMALEIGASISAMELVPIFSIALGTPGDMPEWVVGEVSNE